MKCRECGAENPDNSKYCQECGEKLDETKNHADSETNDSSKVNPRKRILIGIIVLLVIVAFIAALFGSGFSFLGGNKLIKMMKFL